MCVAAGNFAGGFLTYLFQFSRRKIRKGHFVKPRHSFFFSPTHDRFELRTFTLIHTAILLNSAGTLLLCFCYYYGNAAGLNMGLTTAQLSIFTLFYVISAKVLFNDRIYRVQKLAFLFLLVGPIVICLPLRHEKAAFSPIVSFASVMAATLCLAGKQLVVKYLITQGKRRFDLLVYLQFVDAALWTVVAIFYGALHQEIERNFLLVGLIAGLFRAVSNLLQANFNPIPEHNVLVISLHVILTCTILGQSLDAPSAISLGINLVGSILLSWGSMQSTVRAQETREDADVNLEDSFAAPYDMNTTMASFTPAVPKKRA